MDFYEYYKGQMEAWDGPALLVFSNGSQVGCCLDRNGLRPARYWKTNDDTVYVASEVSSMIRCVRKYSLCGQFCRSVEVFE